MKSVWDKPFKLREEGVSHMKLISNQITLEYLINGEEAITVLIMVYPQKHNRLGPNKRTVY